MSSASQTLWYKHPAKSYTEALPIGNGSLGAMVFGGVEDETVGLNLDTLWSGYARSYTVDDKRESFAETRRLTKEGKLLEAFDYATKHMTGDRCQAYLQLGRLKISSRVHICAKKYRRRLDLTTAVTDCAFETGDTEYTREAFASFPDKVIALKMTSQGKKKLDFTVTLNSDLRYDVSTDASTLTLSGLCPSAITETDGEPVIEYFDGEKRGIDFTCMFRVVTDGSVKTDKKHIHISEASEAMIYLTAESCFEDPHTAPCLSKKDHRGICAARLEAAVKKGYEAVKAEHIADYTQFYNRVTIDLGKGKKENVPTNRRLMEFLHNKRNDNDLYALLFNFGRYLTIAASREGSQPMNLQGIWTFTVLSPWNANYTTNINTEMNYWPTLVCSMPEMYQPLIKFMEELAVEGRETAEKYYGARGFCCHHNTDLWRITTAAPGNPVWSFWPMAGAWLCRNLYEHYEYTGDTEYLKNTAYPIMREAALFCLDMLDEDEDGYLMITPSTSPENNFLIGREDCPISRTTYMTMGITRDLFKNTLTAAEILRIGDEVTEGIKAVYDKLLPYRVGSKGQLLEWYDEVKEAEPHHRHVSHLYSLFPADLINVRDTPELAAACRRTLELRGDGGTGWSLGWKINFWARLCDKDKVIKLINNQLRYIKPNARPGRGGTYPNMFDAHPPFQIDGNFGAVSGIAQALMQSYGNRIHILPALPDGWSTGHIHGLTAKGNVRVNIDWENGRLTRLTLKGKGKFEIIYGEKTVEVTLDGSEKEISI